MRPMQQFGSATTITPGIRLILLDCFETLVELDGQTYRPRLGMTEFLTHFSARIGVPIVVISDAPRELVEQAIAQARLASFIVAVYHAGNAMEQLPGGRARKRLDIPVADFGVKGDQAVFIGDSPLDAEAAQHHNVRFIRVPRSEDRTFTFASLITGPSRYQSQEFNLTFLDRYRKGGPDKGGGRP
jgi:phosphoglycolate phosphatase-like HAD superfamily hydrolase